MIGSTSADEPPVEPADMRNRTILRIELRRSRACCWACSCCRVVGCCRVDSSATCRIRNTIQGHIFKKSSLLLHAIVFTNFLSLCCKVFVFDGSNQKSCPPTGMDKLSLFLVIFLSRNSKMFVRYTLSRWTQTKLVAIGHRERWTKTKVTMSFFGNKGTEKRKGFFS